MSLSAIFARLVAFIGAIAILLRHRGDGSLPPAFGSAPAIPTAKRQGIPTLKMPTARGWTAGQTPIAAAGLKVNAFAAGLKHPRWIHVLPNGDVLTAEALSLPGGIASVFDYAILDHDEARRRGRRQPEPHHALARCRRRRRRRIPRNVPRSA